MSDRTDTDDQSSEREAQTDDHNTDATESSDDLGNRGQAALKAERDARKDADKRARLAEKKLADLEAAKAKDDEAKQAEQGQWKELAEKREADLTEATTSRDALKAEYDALSTYFEAQYTAALKDLPDVVKAFAPAEDASFETKSKWLTTAQAEAAKIANTSPRGNGFNPAAGGSNGLPKIESPIPKRSILS